MEYNFIWILVGGIHDMYIGDLRKYALVEYCSDKDTLKLSKFKKSCFYLLEPNNTFTIDEAKIVSIMIKEGAKILFKNKNDNYGYFSNVLDGKYVFNDAENINIENKLKDLVIKECVRKN